MENINRLEFTLFIRNAGTNGIIDIKENPNNVETALISCIILVLNYNFN